MGISAGTLVPIWHHHQPLPHWMKSTPFSPTLDDITTSHSSLVEIINISHSHTVWHHNRPLSHWMTSPPVTHTPYDITISHRHTEWHQHHSLPHWMTSPPVTPSLVDIISHSQTVWHHTQPLTHWMTSPPVTHILYDITISHFHYYYYLLSPTTIDHLLQSHPDPQCIFAQIFHGPAKLTGKTRVGISSSISFS